MNELLPCPFCGDADCELDSHDEQPLCWVVCHGCGARAGLAKTQALALEHWNMRTLVARQSHAPYGCQAQSSHESDEPTPGES